MMKVAIDKGPLVSVHKVRGIGVHTRELLHALEGQTKKPHFAKASRGKLKDLKIEAIDFAKVNLAKYDLLHFPYFHPFFLTIPSKITTKFVVTIHDLIPLIYPKHYPPGIKGKLRFIAQKRRIQKAGGIITISETSKKDIIRFLEVPPKKIYVTYLAPREIFKKFEIGKWKLEIKKRYGLPERFVLYVGDVNYNKNVLGLVKACKIAKVPLVICGKQAKDIEDFSSDIFSLEGPRDWIRYLFGRPHPEQAHYRQLAKEFKNRNIIRLGYIPDGDLVAIYNMASAYCQPSFYEGFGLPIWESFACGTPVVAAKTQALVEIAEGAALFADPKDPHDIADKLTKVIYDAEMRVILIKQGFKKVKSFSWSNTAEKTLEAYREVFSK